MELTVFCTMHPLNPVCQQPKEKLWERCLESTHEDQRYISNYYTHPSGAGYLSMNIESTNYTSCWLFLPTNVTAYVALEHHGSYCGNDILAMVIRKDTEGATVKKLFKGQMNILDKLESYKGSHYSWRYQWSDYSNEITKIDMESPGQIESIEDSHVAIQIHARNFGMNIVWIGNGSIPTELSKSLVLGWDAVENRKVAYVVDLTNGETIKHHDYLFGDRTDLFGSCIFQYRGLTMVAGGYKEISQISAVFPNRIVRISSLPFSLSGATCTSDEEYVYLCFTDDSPRTCWISKDLKSFERLTDSNFDHNAGELTIFNNYPTIVSQNGTVEQLIDTKSNCTEVCKKWTISPTIPSINLAEVENSLLDQPVLFQYHSRLFVTGNVPN